MRQYPINLLLAQAPNQLDASVRLGEGKGDLCDGEHNPLAVGIVCICRLCLRPLKGFNCAFCLPVDIGKVVLSP